MLRPIVRLAAVIPVLFLFAACQPLSKNPLIDPNQADRDERLFGVWVSEPEKNADPAQGKQSIVLHVSPAARPLDPNRQTPEPGLMQAWYQNYNTKDRMFSDPFCLYFVSNPVKDTYVASISEGVDMSVVAHRNATQTKLILDHQKQFWFVSYDVNGDTLKVTGTPKMQVLAEAIAADKLEGTVTKNAQGEIEKVELTSPTDKLRAFFEANVDTLFDKTTAITFHRADILPK
jgi:hypothetical protein